MASLEERLGRVETAVTSHDEILAMLANLQVQLSARQDEHADRMDDHAERMQRLEEILARQEALLAQHDERMQRLDEQLVEIRRDSRRTQRLWVRLAQRYGWLEDEDLGAGE